MTPQLTSLHGAPASCDAQLFEAWRRGDSNAPTTLINRHYDGLLRFFVNRVGARDAEDLAQTTVLACLECRERIRGDASFRSLLFAIAHNVIKQHRRTQRRASRRVERELLPSDPVLPSTAVLLEDERARLQRALTRLPEQARSLLEAHYWDHARLKDIAASEGAPISTIKTRISRARKRLARELDPS